MGGNVSLTSSHQPPFIDWDLVTIQSVLDVKDDTPMPKNAGLQSAFGRSILILTPQRALKFTATTRERHYIWLTALSFLSHSTMGMDDLATIPPVPQQEYKPPPSRDSIARRTPVRDSIRLAKSKARPTVGGHSYTSPVGPHENQTQGAPGIEDEIMSDAAEPPHVPRVSAHGRKRSSTGPRPPLPSATNSFPSNIAAASTHSLRPIASRDVYPPLSRGQLGISSGPGTTSRQSGTYHPTSSSGTVRNNFFETVGTVRMEAFVDRKGELGKAKEVKEKRSYRTRQGRKKDMSYWGMSPPGGSGPKADTDVPAKQEWGEARWLGEDPFQGF